MVWGILAFGIGLVLLVWSADRFVEGASGLARYWGVSPLLIGMVIVGFGTSAPELMVSVIAASQGSGGIALGNAYGSNITNITLILGLTALIRPLTVRSRVLRRELPLLLAVTLVAVWLLWDGRLSRFDGVLLLLIFAVVMTWMIWQGMHQQNDRLAGEMTSTTQASSLGSVLGQVIIGLILLVISSRVLVWGALRMAHALGISDLIIGLTIVALGTSLPELASALVAARKGEHDLVLGNVLGSNLFNTLAVVGLAGVIRPLTVDPKLLSRDMLVMVGLTIALFIIGYGVKKPGRINRWEGALLLAGYCVYTGMLATGRW